MNLARPLAFGLVIVLAIVAALQHRTVAQLRDEHIALEQQLAQAADPAATNPSSLGTDKTSAQALTDEERAEVLRLRGELARSRIHTTELAAAQTENRAARSELDRFNTKKGSATADYWPREAWKFAGFATPDAALQSSLWAANEGDLKTLMGSVTGEMLEHIGTDLQTKDANEATVKAMDEVSAMKSVRIVSRETPDNDTVILTAAIEGPTETQTGKLTLKRVDNQWKVARFSP